MRTIAHVYQTYAEATRVVQSLESAGIPHSDISIVSGDKTVSSTGYDSMGTSGTNTGMTSGDPEQGAATGGGTGATIGTVLGGGAGLLAGIGSLAIPGIGPIVAAGWLVAALTGAGVGAAAGGLLGSLTGAGVSEADAQTYQEGVNSGGTLVTVRADDAQAAHVERMMGMTTGYADTATTGALGAAGTAGLAGGGYESSAGRDAAMGADATGMGTMGTGTTAPVGTTAPMGTNMPKPSGPTSMASDTTTMSSPDTIKVMKEDLVVGKREVEAGGMRVTSHVVETPVQEQVTLHEEHVSIERRPMNERVSSADAFRDQTIEARGTAEEAVVGKDVRVVEEIGLRKEAADRTETVRDSVRETKVDVENVGNTGTTSVTGGIDGTKRMPGV